MGKTTVSSCFALLTARTQKVLLVSTDPAHSLSDLFGTKLGSKPKRISLPESFSGELYGLELDPGHSVKRYERSLLQKVERLNLHLDFDIRGYIHKLASTPGSQEMALFDEFGDLLLSEEWENIVFDTAPTAATLHLLETASLIDQWIAMLVKARESVLKLKEFFRESTDDQVIEELRRMKERFSQIETVLKSESTGFVLVLNPEKLPLEETRRSLGFFREHKLPLRGLVVNRIWPEDEALPPALRAYQQKYLSLIRRDWSDLLLAEIPWWNSEPQGIEALMQLTEHLEKTRLAQLFP